ncbi:leucine--tRNA ligase [Leifsonia soli]|uniref:Leucine--tRNA ligase n=1 Tax=Leifsonia soli TaxID=582665 RepID=A0A852T357_9MICO|nr:leucyl-tRNA synthetase [Leifsonia soli]
MNISDLVGRPYAEVIEELETGVQGLWASWNVNAVDLDTSREKRRYVLGMFPYPSGKPHLGHILVYSIADALARLGRFKGEEVLNPLGWDAFGLPAENAAIQNDARPEEWTATNIHDMRQQIYRTGFSFDPTRELNTSSPDFYRWTQWLFLKLYEHGHAYRTLSWVNWDPVDGTVLANEQVIDGRGWRSGAVIERRQMEQWSLRITQFAQELHDGLDELTGWSPRALSAQRSWIGRSEGAEITFAIEGTGHTVDVFSTRPETVFGASSITLAPEHPLTLELVSPEEAAKVSEYIQVSLRKTELDRQTQNTKTGVRLGRNAIHPITGDRIPIFVSDYVLSTYGSGAIMNVPAHDQRDFEFATAHDLPIPFVILPPNGQFPMAKPDRAYTGDGIMTGSGELDGLSNSAASDAAIAMLSERGVGKASVRFRLRDWSIGRQRYWGCPIPMLESPTGEWRPVPYDQLPVRLPTDVVFGVAGARSPLATSEKFRIVQTPEGEILRREVDTMDTFMDSAWYAWRFLAGSTDEAWPLSHADNWMPLDYYVGGLEHASQHLLYFRYISHFLHSIGFTPTREPVRRFLDSGLIKLGGAKMSKSKGNTVSPRDIIADYGADALRLCLLADTPFELDREWNVKTAAAKMKFLSSVWRLGGQIARTTDGRVITEAPNVSDDWSVGALAMLSEFAEAIEAAVDQRRSFHNAVALLHSFFNVIAHLTTEVGESEARAEVLNFIFQSYLKGLGLFAPHVAEALWQATTCGAGSLFSQPWVPHLQVSRSSAEVQLPVQVNGKLLTVVSVAAPSPDEELREVLPDLVGERLSSALEAGHLERVVVARGTDGRPRLVNYVVR